MWEKILGTGQRAFSELFGGVAATLLAIIVTAVVAHRYWVRRQAWASVYQEKRTAFDAYIEELNEFSRLLHRVDAVVAAANLPAAGEKMHYLVSLQREFGPDPQQCPNPAVRSALSTYYSGAPGVAIEDEQLMSLRRHVRNIFLVEMSNQADKIQLMGWKMRMLVTDSQVVDSYGQFVDAAHAECMDATSKNRPFVRDLFSRWNAELLGLNRELRIDVIQSARGLWWATRRARVRPAMRRIKSKVKGVGTNANTNAEVAAGGGDESSL